MDDIYAQEYQRRLAGRDPSLRAFNADPQWQNTLSEYASWLAQQSSDPDTTSTATITTNAASDDLLEALAALLLRLLVAALWFLLHLLKWTLFLVILPIGFSLGAWIAYLYARHRLLPRLQRFFAGNKFFAAIKALPRTLPVDARWIYYHVRYADSTATVWDGTQSQTYQYNRWDWMLERQRAAVRVFGKLCKWSFLAGFALFVFGSPAKGAFFSSASSPPPTRFVSMSEAAALGWDVPIWAQMAEHTRYQGESSHFPRALSASHSEGVPSAAVTEGQ